MTHALLEHAQAGDHQAFAELVAPYRAELHVHCYRMLGTLSEAEDLVQETLLAAWRGLPAFEGRTTVRSWLYRIATNRCLNMLRDTGRRVPPPAVPPFHPPAPTRHSEVPWLQPYPDALLDQLPDAAPGPEARYDQREAIELAFVRALQLLPPRQAAVLILCDVLGYRVAETADLLDTTPTAVKGMLQRARSSIDGAGAEKAVARSADRPVVQRFADAFANRDVDALLSLLTDDAWLAMPPAPHEYHGRPAIAAFLQVSNSWGKDRRLVLVPTGASNQPAFGCYLAEPGATVANPAGIMVLTLRGDRIQGLTRFFLAEDLLRRYGLPATWVRD